MKSNHIPQNSEVRPAWSKIIWLWLMLLPSLGLGWWALSLERALVAASFGLLTLCLGHSVGLHRGVIHHAYKTSRGFRNVLLWFAALTGVGGPLSMIRVHHQRDYWQNQVEGPAYFAYDHNVVKDFFWNLHGKHGGAHPMPSEWEEQRDDKFLSLMESTWWLQSLGLALALQVTLGWEWVVVCVCMRISAGILGHWSINFVTHSWGKRRYRIPGAMEEGHNNMLLGWLSFGEGFHNNHHAYPSSARMGHGKWEVDVGWWVILGFEKLGLVWEVKAWGREQDGHNPKAHPAS